MWLGVDDTDSSAGMCTTHLAGDLIVAVNDLGLDVIGLPRLVRLNPNVPWKTRGNGAIAIHVGHGRGDSLQIGEVDGERHGYPDCRDDAVDMDRVLDAADAVLRRRAMFDDETTNPGLVVVPEQLPAELYERAVHGIVEQAMVHEFIDMADGRYIGYKNGRGVIGAAASIAWHPGDVTYEVITYRNGGERWVDGASVREMDRCFPSTFDSIDHANGHMAITPHSPCPVLYGIRGDEPAVLPMAMESVASSEVARWLLFETNQATDDHLRQRAIRDIKPYESVVVRGTVADVPHTIEGGHVLFSLSDDDGSIACAAYEPTKQFRDVVRRLRPGDVVTACGGVRPSPLTVNLEKIHVRRLVPCHRKVENPVCPDCGKHMKSHGRNQGYRCAVCGQRAAESEALFERVERGLQPGWYEAPVVARRHLAKPLRRFRRSGA
jgi:tRNA(Ile2)-agmatinylcytidine synthase